MKIPLTDKHITFSDTPPSQGGNRRATVQDLPTRSKVVDNFSEVADYHLTRIGRAHIARLMAQATVKYVDDDGEIIEDKRVRGVLDTISPAALGSLAADIRMMGNAALLKVTARDFGQGELTGLQYKSARGISPVIVAIDSMRYSLVGYKTRIAQTPPVFQSTTAKFVHQLINYRQNVGFNLVTGNTDPPMWLPEQVVHFKEGVDDWYDDLLGDNLLARCADILDYDAKQVDSTVSVLERLFNPSAIVKVLPTEDHKLYAGAENLAQNVLEETQRLQRIAQQQHGGLIPTTYDTEVTEFTGSAGRLTLQGLYNMPEFRYFAMFGLPTALVGMQAGLENSPWSNLATLRRYEYDSTVKPLADIIGETLTREVLGDLGVEGRIVVDTTDMPVLQEEKGIQVDRLLKLLNAKIITVQQVQKELGYEEQDTGNEEDPDEEENE